MEHFSKTIVWDTAKWRFLPAKKGGDLPRLAAFKDGWVSYNKAGIIGAAGRYGIPVLLLAAIAWIEVGGRDLSIHPGASHKSTGGMLPHWAKNQSTGKIKAAAVNTGSLRLLKAVQILGLEPALLLPGQLDKIAAILQTDLSTLDEAAKLLNKLLKAEAPAQGGNKTTGQEQIRMVGERYAAGPGVNAVEFKTKTKTASSYGNEVLTRMLHVEGLLL